MISSFIFAVRIAQTILFIREKGGNSNNFVHFPYSGSKIGNDVL